MSADPLGAYPPPVDAVWAKEIGHLDAHCQEFLALCPFAVLATASADGLPDLSPRGGDPGFLRVADRHTIVLPDRPGNHRLDSLRKASANPRVALLCMVPGIEETLRVYGAARLADPQDVPVETDERGRVPRSVMVITVDKAFLHCAKALKRSRLWDPQARVPRDAWAPAGTVWDSHIANPE
jgi:PPOX class probable FMN-dependent enzyme